MNVSKESHGTIVLLGVGHTHAEILHRWANSPINANSPTGGCRLVCISQFDVATYSGMLPGVFAVRQAPVLWRNLKCRLRNRPLETYHLQQDFLKILNTGDGNALLQYKRFVLHARCCFWLKTWIDKRFIGRFQ